MTAGYAHCEPTVSVIMPAYNCEAYIEKAIRSVMGQSFRDWELIVIDDGSKDSTRDIIGGLASEDDRIIFLPNEKNIGVANTRNRGIEVSRGSYIAFLDSDDIWCPDKLELQLARLRESGADLCYCSYSIIDSEDRKAKSDYLVPQSLDFKGLLRENYIGCSTVLLSKEMLGAQRFLVDYYHEDYVLWLELLQNGASAVGCTEPLVKWRLIQNSRSFDKRRSAAHRWYIYRNHLHFSRCKSCLLFLTYAINGIKKYFY